MLWDLSWDKLLNNRDPYHKEACLMFQASLEKWTTWQIIKKKKYTAKQKNQNNNNKTPGGIDTSYFQTSESHTEIVCWQNCVVLDKGSPMLSWDSETWQHSCYQQLPSQVVVVVVVQSLSRVRQFATSWTAACQPPLSSIISQISSQFMSIDSAMLTNHLILCHPLLLLPWIFPSIRVFSYLYSHL